MRTAMSKQKKIFIRVLMYVLYTMIAFVFIAPILFLLFSAFKPYPQIEADMSNIYAFLPHGKPTLENFTNVIYKVNFFKFFKNSAVVTVIDIVCATIINAMVGYALGMLRFKGRRMWISLIVAFSIIPTESIIINRFIVINRLGLLNSYIGLAIPSIAYPMYMYLYYNHFKGMPIDLQEAAILDGASYSKIFWMIMIPLSKPILTTVAIMAFIRSWGDLLWPTLVTRDNTYRTLPLALNSLQSDVYTDWGQVFAFSLLMVIPVLVTFLLFQKQFISSMTSSGIKG